MSIRCVVLSLLTISTVLAQSPEATSPSRPTQDLKAAAPDTPSGLRGFGQDELHIWTSPFKGGNYNPHTLKKYVIPFTMLSAALIATDSKTGDLLPNTPNQRKWSGRVSQIGASYTLASVSGGTYLLGRITGNAHVKETGWLALNAFGHSQIATLVIKELTNRRRPLTAENTSGFWKGGNSFPSGHASTAFAVATVFAYEYRQHPPVPIVAYSLAGAVAASRIGAQRHWLSDVVVGGSTGFLIGRYVYKQHHDPSLPGSSVQSTNHLAPEVSLSPDTVSLTWKF